MSTSSQSNSSNTGPNRFRGDAASFSPSAQSPTILQQQMIHQQMQQQQYYNQYLYPGAMMPNQFYQYLPHYVVPNGPGFPPEAAYYPYGGYQVPPPHIYKQNFPNNGGQMYHRQKNGLKKNYNKNNNSSSPPNISSGSASNENLTSSNFLSSGQSVETLKPHWPFTANESGSRIISQSESTAGSSGKSSSTSDSSVNPDNGLRHVQNGHAITSGEVSTMTEKLEKFDKADKVEGSFPIAESDITQNHGKVMEEVRTLENIKGQYPLFFNVDSKAFNESYPQLSENRKKLNQAKVEKLNAPSTGRESTALIITAESENIHDINTDKIVKGKVELRQKLEITLGTMPQIIELNQPNDWASILYSTSSKKPSKLKLTSPSRTLHQSPTQPQEKRPTGVEQAKMNGDSPYSLGILLLKVMHDPEYSLTNRESFVTKSSLKPKGLINSGNICYMNSILQILVFIEPFYKLIQIISSQLMGSLGDNSTTPLIDATINLFKEFHKNESGNRPISPDKFFSALTNHKKFQHLKWGQQEDAEEFLGNFLEGLNEELIKAFNQLTTDMVNRFVDSYTLRITDHKKFNKFRSDVHNTMNHMHKSNENKNKGVTSDSELTNLNVWSEVGSNNKKISINRSIEVEPTPIEHIFGGQFRSVLTIPKSSSQEDKSITLDPFRNIQLDISDASSIEEAFIQMSKQEHIAFKNSSKEISVKKQTFINATPNLLVIHLKRFSYLREPETGVEKIKKKVAYNFTLTIPEDVFSNLNTTPEEYKLIGVVYHHGHGAEGGHYTTDVLKGSHFQSLSQNQIHGHSYNNHHQRIASPEPQEEWIRIDDTSISAIKPEEVLESANETTSKNAYILFYQKI